MVYVDVVFDDDVGVFEFVCEFVECVFVGVYWFEDVLVCSDVLGVCECGGDGE